MTTSALNSPGVGCGAAIFNPDGQILLIQRLKAPEAEAWGLPGGKIDFGEAVKAAIIREIKEELGIDIRLIPPVYITEIIDKGDGRHWVSSVYKAHIIKGEPQLMEPEKHGGWAWYDLTRLPEYLTTPTRQFLARYIKETAK
jgi:ADP-ribose pyrophosphatase YjhB (NUDIX family)